MFLEKVSLDKVLFNVSRFLLGAFVFLFPFNIRALIFSETLFYGGNLNAFTAGFLYLNDVVLFLAVLAFLLYSLVSGFEFRRFQGGFFVLGVLFLLFVNLHSLFWAGDLEVAFYGVFRLMSFGIFIWLAWQRILAVETLVMIFVGSMVFQSAIGIFQYVLQHDLGLGVLGESRLGSDVLGVAKIEVGGRQMIRSYGTFLHSNIFAGGILVAMVVVVERMKKDWLYGLILLVLVIGLIFTFSRSAWLALVVGGFVWYSLQDKRLNIPWKYVGLGGSLLLFAVIALNLEGVIWERIFSDSSAAGIERWIFFDAAKNMAMDNWMGVGLRNFTLEMSNYSVVALQPWLMQPVHNVFALVVAELGVVGFAFLSGISIYFLVEVFRKRAFVFCSLLVAMFIIMLFDHYFFTLYAGQFLIAFVVLLGMDKMAQSRS